MKSISIFRYAGVVFDPCCWGCWKLLWKDINWRWQWMIVNFALHQLADRDCCPDQDIMLLIKRRQHLLDWRREFRQEAERFRKDFDTLKV